MKFKANVEYNDYIGTIAADDRDTSSVQLFVRNKLGLNNIERIVGFEFSPFYDLISDKIILINMYVYICIEENIETLIKEKKVIPVKKAHIEISINEFFSLFKRLDIFLSKNGQLNNLELKIFN